MRWGAVAGLGVGLIVSACTGLDVFACQSDDECIGGDGPGTCEAVGYCSFPDDTCPSGQRFGDAASGTFAGNCVDPQSETGSTSASSDSSNGATTTTTSTTGSTSTSTTLTTTSSSTTDSATTAVSATGSTGDSTSEGSESDGSTGTAESCPTQADANTIALYHLDSTSSLEDDAGTYDGMWRDGPPSLVEGPQGCGMATAFENGLDGVIPNDLAFELDEGSFDFWVLLPSPSNGAGMGLVSRDAEGSMNGGHLTIWYAGQGRIGVRHQSGGGGGGNDHTVCSDGTLPTGTWLHVGVNFGSAGLELYIDGEEQTGTGMVYLLTNPSNCGGGPTPFGIEGNTNPWVIGGSTAFSEEGTGTPVSGAFEGGALDEFRISSIRRSF